MRALIAGAGGQLGRELVATAPAGVDVVAADRSRLDVTDAAAVRQAIQGSRADVVINASGYTAVDRAESDRAAAFDVNALGPANLARAAVDAGARLVHVSTDFVFDGCRSSPYPPDAVPNPLSVYGESKLAGERSVQEVTDGRGVIVRTAWVYAARGSNFVNTMLRLMGERDELRVVVDQVGTPTRARGLARALWSAASAPEVRGTLHWTDAGVASWYDFAVAIQEEAIVVGRLRREPPIVPVLTQAYPTAAKRPAYSVLDKTSTWSVLGMTAPHWRVSLRRMLEESPNG